MTRRRSQKLPVPKPRSLYVLLYSQGFLCLWQREKDFDVASGAKQPRVAILECKSNISVLDVHRGLPAGQSLASGMHIASRNGEVYRPDESHLAPLTVLT